MQTRNVVVPVEFVQDAKEAIQYAIHLGKNWKVKIIFVHGYAPDSVPALMPRPGVSANPLVVAPVEQHKLYSELMKDYLNQFDLLSAINYTYLVAPGETVDVICKTALEKNADLIVLDTEGVHEMDPSLKGTIWEKLIRKESCPVLIVPKVLASYTLETLSLVLDSNSLENPINLDLLVEILKVSKAKLRIVHISENGDTVFKKKELLNYYRESLQKIKHSFHVFYDNNIHDGIHEFLSSYPVDLLVLLHKERGGFCERLFQPGVGKKKSLNTNIPMLIIK